MADGERSARRAGALNILVLAVGKAAKAPERELCARYLERLAGVGRQLGLAAVEVREVADATGPTRAAMEADRLLALRRTGPLVALDERGPARSSEAFAAWLGAALESGVQTLHFAIGGADGHGPAVRAAADETLSFGPMTLPHLLVRVLLLEQIYRAVTIRLGHPYHRA